MLIIRFNRTGKKDRVSYRLVLQEKSKAPGKRHVEILGSHDPHHKTTILKKDRILHWLGQGVQCSDVVHNLLIREGVIEGKKIARKMPRPVAKEEPAVEEAVEPVAEVAETPVEEAVGTEPVEEVKEEVAAVEEKAEEAVGTEPVEVKEEVVAEAPAVEEVAESVAEEVKTEEVA